MREVLRLRWLALTRRQEFLQAMAEETTGMPVYATAEPLRIFQHWAPSLLTPVTYCGRVTAERSTGEIRTKIGWHCRTCHRRVKRILKQRKEDRG